MVAYILLGISLAIHVFTLFSLRQLGTVVVRTADRLRDFENAGPAATAPDPAGLVDLPVAPGYDPRFKQ
jgi:hypothetical protein